MLGYYLSKENDDDDDDDGEVSLKQNGCRMQAAGGSPRK